MYDKNGFLISDIYNPLTYPEKVTGTSEYLIIPVPGNCSQYFLVAGSYDYPNIQITIGGVPHPYYITLDLSLPNQNGYGPTIHGDMIGANGLYDNIGILLDNPSATLDFVDGNNSKSSCLHFAVSPLRTATNDRFLYIEYRVCGRLARFKVTSGGIAYDNYNFQLITANLAGIIRAEMELAVLPSGNYRIAFPYEEGSNFIQMIHVADYSSVTGDIIPGTTISIALPSGAKMHGLEFSKDGRYLYVTHTVTPYVQYIDLQTSSTLTPLQSDLSFATQALMNPIDFQYSQIELDNNGYMLFARGNDISGMNINFNQGPLNQNWVQGVIQTGVPINVSIYTNGYLVDAIVNSRQLNDQIDGALYQYYPPTSPPDLCCIANTNFTVDIYTAGTYIPNVTPSTFNYAATTQTWTPTNNPFGGTPSTPVPIITIKTSLIIPAGYKITISGMTLEFAPRTYDANNNDYAGANLEIRRANTTTGMGGKLTVFNSVLTVYDDCGKGMWEGVEVHGYQNVPQGMPGAGPQGYLLLSGSGSRIEHAWWGAVAGEVNTTLTYNMPQIVSGTGGAVITGNPGAQFLNNKISVYFAPHNGVPAAADDNASGFNLCAFQTTDDLWDINAGSPYAAVMMRSVKGILFAGNTFLTDELTTNYTVAANNTGYGILSYNTFFMVVPASGNVRNTFTNLTYGIAAASGAGTRTATIDQADFYNNYRGIYLSLIPVATITRCNFEIYRWPTTQPNEAYGVYLNYCTGFKVQENDFTYSLGNTPPANAYGIIVNQSNAARNCGQDDEIYRNTFHNIMVGIQAQGYNSENPYPACYTNAPGTTNNIGLVMRCNEFYAGTVDAFDIRVADYVTPFSTRWGNIAYEQGTCTGPNGPVSPANNLFSHSSNAFSETDFRIDGTYSISNPNGIQYAWSTANQTIPYLTPIDYTAPVPGTGVDLGGCGAYTYSSGTSCPSKLVYSPANISVQRDISLYAFRADSLNNILTMGDDPSLYAVISGGTPGHISSALLSASPYLSDGVLMAAINRGLPPGVLKQIIIANSPVSQSVMNVLNAINLPPGIRSEINSVQNGVSARDRLISLLSSYITAKSYAVNELIRQYLNDTLSSTSVDSVILALKKYQVPEFRCSLVKAYSDKGDTLSAKLQRDTLEMEQGLDNFCRLYDLLLELERAGQTCYAIAQDSVKQATVSAISADYEEKTCADANAIMNLVLQYHFSEYITSISNSSNREAPQPEPQRSVSETGFTVYPNPNNGTFVLDYYVEETDVVVFEVYSITGSMMKTEILPASSQQKDMELSGFAPGVYLIRIKVNDAPKHTERIIITE